MSLVDDLLACTPAEPPLGDNTLLVAAAEEMICARARVLCRHFEGRCDLSGDVAELHAREARWDAALRRALDDTSARCDNTSRA